MNENLQIIKQLADKVKFPDGVNACTPALTAMQAHATTANATPESIAQTYREVFCMLSTGLTVAEYIALTKTG